MFLSIREIRVIRVPPWFRILTVVSGHARWAKTRHNLEFADTLHVILNEVKNLKPKKAEILPPVTAGFRMTDAPHLRPPMNERATTSEAPT